jgi:hypothetical protein
MAHPLWGASGDLLVYSSPRVLLVGVGNVFYTILVLIVSLNRRWNRELGNHRRGDQKSVQEHAQGRQGGFLAVRVPPLG